MKRILLLMLSVIVSTMMMADDVTPQQALEQASQFVKSRKARDGGPRLAPGTQPKLTLASRVSDLYVFNINGDAGYVIVSNDDVAVPILGYSDSGSFDANNIPDNMRAWLQGYADEIAWAKANHVEIVNDSPYARANAPRRTGTAVKTAIAPLVTTRWNQGTPYNNLCPEYNSDKSATGCVATAMAQCMYFTEKRAGSTITYTTEQILGYNTETRGLEVDAVAANTPIYWSKMRNTYTASDTDEGAAAVAELMLYCGTSVQMDYYVDNQGSSGAQTHSVATALKSYFGYNTTTTYVQRSFYTYANWIELMYHELYLGRVICYGGQSSGGGHEFVVDGYQSEDYFHVNWGWGGQSDDYFKLSALDPESQGIGGSSSTDGFHYGQDAIIGIQKSTEDLGAVADVHVNTNNLSRNDVTFSENPTQYSEVTVNIDLKNNSNDPYDGDIGIRVFYYEDNTWYYVDDISNTFLIPAKAASETVQLKFTPIYSGTYGVKVYRPAEMPGYIYWIGYTNADDQTQVDVAAASVDPDLDLTFGMPVIESPYQVTSLSPITADLYGTRLKGSIGVKNNNETAYFGEVGWELLDGSLRRVASHYISGVTLAARETRQVSIDVSGLEIGETYRLYGVWSVGSSYNASYITINTQPGILTYAADGTETFVKPSGTSYDALTNAATALVVDVTGTGITGITPNANPNTLYISDVPLTGLDDHNVVTYSGGSYTASNITLTDGSGFYSPVDFTAANIEFVYNNSKQADGTNGWNSLMLPFNVTSVTADGTSIDWFHSGTDTGKQFWVKKFVSDEANQVYFDYAEEMTANTPYIVALPGNHWGAAYDLSGKVIKFIGENVTVSKGDAMTSVTGSNYRFVGSTVQDNTTNIYCLNAAGNAFALTDGSGPFRAYFKPGTFNSSVTMLGIGNWTGDATGIQGLSRETITDNVYYDLQGRRVEHPTKGVYVVNGKKVVIK